MKKLLLSLLFLPAVSFAQYDASPAPNAGSAAYKNVRLGFYIAPTSSWMRPTANKDDEGNFDVASNGSKIGFMYGLMADFYFAENYAIATGLQVDHNGGKILATRVQGTVNPAVDHVQKADFEYSFQYLEIPLNVKLRTYELGSAGLRIFGQAGLSLGFNIGKKATYTVQYYDAATQTSETASGDHVKLTGSLTAAPINLQMNIGAGIEYSLTNNISLYGGLFFNNGFLPDATNPKNYNADLLGYKAGNQYGKGGFADGNTRLNNLALRIGVFF